MSRYLAGWGRLMPFLLWSASAVCRPILFRSLFVNGQPISCLANLTQQTGALVPSRRRFLNSLAAWALSFLVLTPLTLAQTPPAEAWREAPPTSTGVAVGKPIPAFSIPDQNGQPRDFKSIVGPNGAMIVFQRSVDW